MLLLDDGILVLKDGVIGIFLELLVILELFL